MIYSGFVRFRGAFGGNFRRNPKGMRHPGRAQLKHHAAFLKFAALHLAEHFQRLEIGSIPGWSMHGIIHPALFFSIHEHDIFAEFFQQLRHLFLFARHFLCHRGIHVKGDHVYMYISVAHHDVPAVFLQNIPGIPPAYCPALSPWHCPAYYTIAHPAYYTIAHPAFTCGEIAAACHGVSDKYTCAAHQVYLQL